MLRTFGRLLLVPIALLLAAVAVAAVLVTLGQERVVKALSANDLNFDGVMGQLALLARLAMAAFSVATLLPVLLLVVAGEVGRIRTPIYYVVGGGVALAVVPLLARVGADGAGLWPIFATAGFAGGFIYWLVAGRSA